MTKKMPPLPAGSIDGDALERAAKAGKLDEDTIAKAIETPKQTKDSEARVARLKAAEEDAEDHDGLKAPAKSTDTKA